MTENTLVKVIFQGLYQKIFSWFLLYFGKLETAILKDHLSVPASESNYVNNTVGTYNNLPVSSLYQKRFQSGKKKGTTCF